jgi:hypothetical protein
MYKIQWTDISKENQWFHTPLQTNPMIIEVVVSGRIVVCQN